MPAARLRIYYLERKARPRGCLGLEPQVQTLPLSFALG